MAKRFTDSEKWKKPFIKKLPMQYKLLWFYLLDDCNHAGVWQVDLEIASLRIGYKLNLKDSITALNDKIKVFDNGEKWFIKDFIEFQYGELNEKNRAHKSVISVLNKYNLLSLNKPLTSPSQGAKDKDKDKDIVKAKVKAKRFVKPTIEEVADYCEERSNNVDAEKFYDYYSSNGWKVGKNAMKDWKASVRTWEKNTTQSEKVSQPKQVLTSWQQAREQINNG